MNAHQRRRLRRRAERFWRDWSTAFQEELLKQWAAHQLEERSSNAVSQRLTGEVEGNRSVSPEVHLPSE